MGDNYILLPPCEGWGVENLKSKNNMANKKEALELYEELIEKGTTLAINADAYKRQLSNINGQLSSINNQLAEVDGALKALEDLFEFDRQEVAQNMQENKKKEEA